MSTIHEPFVKEVATNKPTAVQNFTVAGVGVTNFRAISAAYSNGDIIPITAKNANNSLWEESECTLSTGVLTRTKILKSSNSDAAVDFSGSATDITLSVGWQSSYGQNNILAIETHITGLGLVFNSTTSISVKPGSAYIPGTNKVCNVPSLLTDSSLTGLTANIWYYVYLYDNAGTPAIEVSSTAPTTAYAGNARTKTGDTTRRFIGAFHTITGGAIQGFKHNTTLGLYEYGGTDSPFIRALANGTATTDTNFSCAMGVPPQSTQGYFRVINTNPSGGWVGFAPGGTTSVTSNITYACDPAKDMVLFIPTDSSQQLAYAFSATPSAGAYCDILGFLLEV